MRVLLDSFLSSGVNIGVLCGTGAGDDWADSDALLSMHSRRSAVQGKTGEELFLSTELDLVPIPHTNRD